MESTGWVEGLAMGGNPAIDANAFDQMSKVANDVP